MNGLISTLEIRDMITKTRKINLAPQFNNVFKRCEGTFKSYVNQDQFISFRSCQNRDIGIKVRGSKCILIINNAEMKTYNDPTAAAEAVIRNLISDFDNLR